MHNFTMGNVRLQKGIINSALNFTILFPAQHNGSDRWGWKLICRPEFTLRQRGSLELRRLSTARLRPPTTSATSMARGPRRLRLKGRFFLVRDVVAAGDLRQHHHSWLADPLRRHLPQRGRHRRVRHRPRLGPPRSGRHDL